MYIHCNIYINGMLWGCYINNNNRKCKRTQIWFTYIKAGVSPQNAVLVEPSPIIQKVDFNYKTSVYNIFFWL